MKKVDANVTGTGGKPRHIMGMIGVAALLVVLSGCSALPGGAQQSVGQHGVDITASSTEINVGDEVTITGDSGGVGMASMGMSFSSGGKIGALYSESASPEPDSPDSMFEFVSITNDHGLIVVLRAIKPGKSTITFSASGEVGSHDTGYLWSGGTDSIDITVK